MGADPPAADVPPLLPVAECVPPTAFVPPVSEPPAVLTVPPMVIPPVALPIAFVPRVHAGKGAAHRNCTAEWDQDPKKISIHQNLPASPAEPMPIIDSHPTQRAPCRLLVVCRGRH